MTPDSAIATAADYADAMITARRAKKVLVLLLLLMILAQLAVFLLMRYDVFAVAPTTATATTQPAPASHHRLHYLATGCMFAGVTFGVVLGFVLLLIVNIMLVGRLIGVARLTSAYIWSLILLVFLFPWQAFLDNVGLTIEQAPFKLPGVMYTWTELMDPNQGAHFASSLSTFALLKWWRFVGYPLVAIIILLIIQTKSNRGMRQALGEDEAGATQVNTQ
jgi:hypothetical protein